MSSTGIPTPVSDTVSMSLSIDDAHRTAMRPPSGVYSTAFEMRFVRTCNRHSLSAVMEEGKSFLSTLISMPLASRFPEVSVNASSIREFTSTGPRRTVPALRNLERLSRSSAYAWANSIFFLALESISLPLSVISPE